MKAIQIDAYGGSEVFTIRENVPTPESKEHQLLVEVKAASINPFDIALISGIFKDQMPLAFPVTVGGNFAGIVVQTGEEVYGNALVLTGGSGAFAKMATVSPGSIAKKPTTIVFAEAAALPLVGASAVQALEEHMHLKKDQKILIHGGAGGIGHIAIQLAKVHGAYVVTTVRTECREFALSLGADEVINYTREDFSLKCKDFDAVFDTAGGDVAAKSFPVLKKGGILVSMTGQPDQTLAKKYEVTAIGQATKTDTAHLDRVRELVDNGKIKVQVDKTFTLDQAKEAWEYQKSGHPKGKVVVLI